MFIRDQNSSKNSQKNKAEFLATSSETGLDLELGSLTSHSMQPWPLISQGADEEQPASGLGFRIPSAEISGLLRLEVIHSAAILVSGSFR